MQKSITFAAVLKKLSDVSTIIHRFVYAMECWDYGSTQTDSGQFGNKNPTTRYKGTHRQRPRDNHALEWRV